MHTLHKGIAVHIDRRNGQRPTLQAESACVRTASQQSLRTAHTHTTQRQGAEGQGRLAALLTSPEQAWCIGRGVRFNSVGDIRPVRQVAWPDGRRASYTSCGPI